MAITKEKGDLAQSLVMADLFRRGFKVLFPIGEDWKFDLVIYRDKKFERIQCKSDFKSVDYVKCNCRSSNNWSVKKYTYEDVDWIATYHGGSDKVYYIPSSMFKNGRNMFNLRINATKNNQQTGVLWAKDFTKF